MSHQVVYPCRKHAAKVFQQLFKKDPATRPVIYLQGHSTSYRDDSDREMGFRQESNFMYLTGAATVRGASAIISLSPEFNHTTRPSITEEHVRTALFIPPIDPAEVMWCGLPPSALEVHRDLPSLSHVGVIDELAEYLSSLIPHSALITLPHTTYPGARPDPDLLAALHEARTRKTEEEIQIMRQANQISSDAHEAVMKSIGRSELSSELEAESVFLTACRSRNAKLQAYEPIFGHGVHAGTLHYTANNATFASGFEGLLLVDAGCEVLGYASDITRTLPIGNGGRFTKEAREIYEIVLEMQDAGIKTIKTGVDWKDIQILMHKVAAKGLLKLGILKNLSVDECYEAGHVIPFFPHGVGHFLGLDTHDVAGLPDGKGAHPTLKYLRLQRILETGNVVTVEPGLYFNQFLLEPTQASEYVDHEVLKRYMHVGGVRIEDNVVVREDGCENLTKAVKSVEEVERLCSGGQ